MLTGRIVALDPIETPSPISVFFPLCFVALCRPSILKKIINEHDAVPDKTFIPDRYKLTNKGMRLNFTVRPDHHILLYAADL